MKKQTKNRCTEKNERIQRDLVLYGSRILDSDEMQSAFTQKHHTLSTVGDHTMRVARKSLFICYALQKLHIQTDIRAVVTGALCHDLGILGRDEKYGSERECSRQHPVHSVQVAEKLVGDLPDKTADIISHHMWPGGNSDLPRSREAVIVSAADKLAAVEDFVMGYREKRPGVRHVVREALHRTKDMNAE